MSYDLVQHPVGAPPQTRADFSSVINRVQERIASDNSIAATAAAAIAASAAVSATDEASRGGGGVGDGSTDDDESNDGNTGSSAPLIAQTPHVAMGALVVTEEVCGPECLFVFAPVSFLC